MIIYVSMKFETNIGAKVHRKILEEYYGESNIYVVDLRPRQYEKKSRYVCYGKYKSPLHRMARWVQGNTMFISNSIIRDVCSLVKKTNAELVFLENSTFGNLIRAIKQCSPNTRVICFYHDIDADLYQQRNQKARIQDRIENSIAIKQESVCQQYSDANIVFNKRDAELFEKYYHKKPEYQMPLSSFVTELDTRFTKQSPSKASDKKRLLFVGSKYLPNMQGIRWFYNNVLPSLNDKIELDIVGRGTEFLKEEFTDSRVHVLGTVDDIFKYYYESDIFIAPLFSGGGMKAKSIEAISLGKCFVGNDESLAGFWEEMDETVRNRVVFKCDTAEDWISTLNKLTGETIFKHNQELYDIFINKFSYDRTKEHFIEMLADGKE